MKEFEHYYYPIIPDEYFIPLTEEAVDGIDNDRYEISNHGRVYDKKMKKFNSVYNQNQGYLVVYLHTVYGGKVFLLHRLVAIAFHGNCGNMDVNHKDYNRKNPAAWNLEWATRSDNLKHSYMGPNNKIENSYFAIISEADAIRICEEIDRINDCNFSYKKLVKSLQLNCSYQLIGHIHAGETWTHISKNYNFSKNNYEQYRNRSRVKALRLKNESPTTIERVAREKYSSE